MNFKPEFTNTGTDRRNVFTCTGPNPLSQLFFGSSPHIERTSFNIPPPSPASGIDPSVLSPTGQIIVNTPLVGSNTAPPLSRVFYNETQYSEDEKMGVVLLHTYFSTKLIEIKDEVVAFWSQGTIDEIMAQCPNYVIPFLKPYVIYGTLKAFQKPQSHVTIPAGDDVHALYKNCDAEFDSGVLTAEQIELNSNLYKTTNEELWTFSGLLSTRNKQKKTLQNKISYLEGIKGKMDPGHFASTVAKYSEEINKVESEINNSELAIANHKNVLRDLLYNWLCNRCASDTNAGQRKNYHQLTSAIFLRLHKSICSFNVARLSEIDVSHRLVIVQGISFLLSETMQGLCGQPAIAYYDNLNVFKSISARKNGILSGYQIFRIIVDDANFIEGFGRRCDLENIPYY